MAGARKGGEGRILGAREARGESAERGGSREGQQKVRTVEVEYRAWF